MFVFLYFVSAIMVGVLAIGRGGFALFFILALGLSPIIALLILLVASPALARRGRERCTCDDCENRRRRRSY